MRQDNRPYPIRRLRDAFQKAWTKHFLVPGFESVGPGLDVTNPWDVELWGKGITAGANFHLHASRGNLVRIATWQAKDRHGHVTIGDNVLISPGTQIISSIDITIGSNTMMATGVYISDSDWHDTYDRTAEHDKYAPVRIGDNAWLGVRAIIGKGVTIGDNSIIGAGSVVTRDVPANTIAAGNPARVVRELDPEHPRRRRANLFEDPEKLARDVDQLQRYLLRDNTYWRWLRSIFAPTRED